ncbi:unnamed protein product [Cuscuta campestris]|uniref:Epidermal patterning factor-like protein n=2 Tax=Cuscuta sect. Cleistogrammica TaxID=1824901 RepID=A0A484KBF7_9ASTE|nr:hypothetical protein DM860_005289 [Cuscuta australis]VFQ61184.1 unnamed protein product [Cuscuta campestris]
MASNVFRSVLKLALIVILFYSMALLPSISGRGKQMMMRMALGSRPPRCVGRCMGCRPCVAALVIPPHHKRRQPRWWFKRTTASGGGGPGEDENYYLLSWKCRCRNKYFQP